MTQKLWAIKSIVQQLGITVQRTDAEPKNLKDTWEEAEEIIGRNILGKKTKEGRRWRMTYGKMLLQFQYFEKVSSYESISWKISLRLSAILKGLSLLLWSPLSGHYPLFCALLLLWCHLSPLPSILPADRLSRGFPGKGLKAQRPQCPLCPPFPLLSLCLCLHLSPSLPPARLRPLEGHVVLASLENTLLASNVQSK